MKSAYSSLDQARRHALTSAVISFAVMGVLAGLYLQELFAPARPILWLVMIVSASSLMIFSEQARQMQRLRPRSRAPQTSSGSESERTSAPELEASIR